MHLLQQADLRVSSVESRPARAQAGSVIAQRPQPCGNLDESGSVAIVVSSGDERRETPPRREGGGGPSIGTVAAVAAAAAIGAAIIASRNRKKDKADERPAPPAEEKPAPAEEPAPPAEEPAPPVPLTPPPAPPSIARTAVVPPVIGFSLAEAQGAISAAQLRTVMTNPEEGQRPNASVSSQVPVAGTPVVPGAAVAVTLIAPSVPQAPADPPPAPAATPVSRPVTPRPAAPGPAPSSAVPVSAVPTPSVPADAAQPAPSVEPPSDVPPASTFGIPSRPIVGFYVSPFAITPTIPVVDGEPRVPWLWIVLVLALIVAIGSWPHRARALPPSHFTFLPRVDAGSQDITAGGRSRLDVAISIDAGVQQIHCHSSVARIGA